jgi:hypothetical protein
MGSEEQRKPWVPMTVRFLGRLGDLVLGEGSAKPMVSLGDPGEPNRKPSGQPG